jgi:hypothetical protein
MESPDCQTTNPLGDPAVIVCDGADVGDSGVVVVVGMAMVDVVVASGCVVEVTALK